MKTKKFNQKLTLSKVTVSHLTTPQMTQLAGGATFTCVENTCDPTYTCNDITWDCVSDRRTVCDFRTDCANCTIENCALL